MDQFKERKPDRRNGTKITMSEDEIFFTIPRGDKILVSRDRRLSKRRDLKKIVDSTDDTIWAEE